MSHGPRVYQYEYRENPKILEDNQTYPHHDLVRNLRAYSALTILLALVLTIGNYGILTFYDVLAMKYVGKNLSYGKIAFTSFLSYVFSYPTFGS